MQPWIPIPIDAPLNVNVDPLILPKGALALENAYIGETGAHVRFPGLTPFCQLGDAGNVYLGADFLGDLICGTSLGNVYRVAANGGFNAVQGDKVEGGERIIFAPTDDRIVMAAGAEIIQYTDERTSILSPDAPLATHIAFIDSYLVANEIGSQRFHYCNPGDYGNWQPLDVLAADSKPTPATGLHVTPYRELLVYGPDRIEQWMRLLTGDIPFFRQWGVGEGVRAPYTMVSADNAAWVVNRDHEFIRFAGQAGQPGSNEIQKALDGADSWDGAWAGGHPDRPLTIDGQRFLVLQLPNATNSYGSKGITFALDFRNKRWLNLYGWNSATAQRTRWPGWSYFPMWDQIYVGGPAGAIYRLDPTVHNNAGSIQKMVGRTAHMSEEGEIRIDALRMRLKRGFGGNISPLPKFRFRCNRDNGRWSRWQERDVGRSGDGFLYVHFGCFGDGTSFLFEWECTDDTDLEIVKLEAQITKLGF